MKPTRLLIRPGSQYTISNKLHEYKETLLDRVSLLPLYLFLVVVLLLLLLSTLCTKRNPAFGCSADDVYTDVDF